MKAATEFPRKSVRTRLSSRARKARARVRRQRVRTLSVPRNK